MTIGREKEKFISNNFPYSQLKAKEQWDRVTGKKESRLSAAVRMNFADRLQPRKINLGKQKKNTKGSLFQQLVCAHKSSNTSCSNKSKCILYYMLHFLKCYSIHEIKCLA